MLLNHSSDRPIKLRAPRLKATKWMAFVTVAILGMSWTASATAQGAGPFGLGLILGEPSGLTGKYWLDGAQGVQAHLAFSLDEHDRGRDYFIVIADYLYHIDVFNMKSSSVDLPIYVGIGGKISILTDNDDYCNDRFHDNRYCDDDNDVGLGVRIPVGLDLLLRKAPLEFFLEIVPGLRIFPSTDGDIDGGLGARYYF